MKEKSFVKEEYLKDLKCSIFYLSKEALLIINLEKNELIIRKEIYDNVSCIPNSEGIPFEFLKKGDWYLFGEESYKSKAELLSDEIYKAGIGLVKSNRLRLKILKLSEKEDLY